MRKRTTLLFFAALASALSFGEATSGRQTVQEVRQAVCSTPLLAPNETDRWNGEYTTFFDYGIDRATGQSVAAPVQGKPPVTTFELEETFCNGEHHLALRPLKVAESHQSYSFGRGTDYWSETRGKDLVVFHDQKIAQVSTRYTPTQLLPFDLVSPHKLLQFLGSDDPVVWANVLINISSDDSSETRKVVAGRPEPLPVDDPDLVAFRETARFPNVISGGKPMEVSRDIYYSKSVGMLPVRAEFLMADLAPTTWRLEWLPAQTGSPPAAGGLVRGHRLVTLTGDMPVFSDAAKTDATVRYHLLDAAELTPEAVAAGLTPVIPDGYRVIDVDAMANANATGTSGAGFAASPADNTTLIAILVTVTTLVIALIFVRRRLAKA